jgi:hypothetical protein
MTGPEDDSDLNEEYREKLREREASQEKITGIGFFGAFFIGRRPDPTKPRVGWLQNRQAKVIAEIERNRRGEYRIPTWVLMVMLVAVIVGLVVLFTFF